MTLKLRELSPSVSADSALIPAIARVHLAAWLTNTLYKTIYFGPPSSHAAIIETNRQRHMQNFTSNPSARFAVILDDRIGNDENPDQPAASQLIAWAKYDIFATPDAAESRQDTGKRTWPPYTNVALVNHFWDMLVISRHQNSKAIGAHISVDLLATDPVHHRRGAGRMLMQYIAKQADELGLRATIEGSPEGLKLYRSVGFELVDEFWVDLLRFEGGEDKGEKWAEDQGRTPGQGPGWYKQVAMLRQPVRLE
jgi:GNAT superfamily N-acetyltransferase